MEKGEQVVVVRMREEEEEKVVMVVWALEMQSGLSSESIE